MTLSPVTLWLAREPLVLASKSEIRRTVLAAAGIPLDVHPASIDERALEQEAADASAIGVAAMLARVKALAAAKPLPGRLVLGADQTLGFEGRVFSKSDDRAGVRAQLLRLRGQTHELHSAIAVVRGEEVLFEHVSTARLTMRAFSESFLDSYLDAVGDAALQSVGGYQLEALGVHLFDRIDGDHFTILGLPLIPLLGFLRTHGCLDD